MEVGDIVKKDDGAAGLKEILILNYDGEKVHFQYTGTNKTDTLLLEDFEWVTGQTLIKPVKPLTEGNTQGQMSDKLPDEVPPRPNKFGAEGKSSNCVSVVPAKVRKRKILLVTDVYGWGGHERALKLQEHLSDEFDFDIMNADNFSKFEEESNDCFVKWKRLATIIEKGKLLSTCFKKVKLNICN